MYNPAMSSPHWLRVKPEWILIPAAGAVLLGGAGWLLSPLWAVAGALAGAVGVFSVLLIVASRRMPDAPSLVAAGRWQEAYRALERDISFNRRLAAKRPAFRSVLAWQLEAMSKVLHELGDEPRALDAATEAVALYTELTAKNSGRDDKALAGTLFRQAVLQAHMGLHGEALAAIEPAVQIYRRLAVGDRSANLPNLAAALTRQADELGHLGRIDEARAGAAEAEMIRADMLPSARA
jgi:tetratricopeptide (TPR) repeat protein